MAYSTYTTEALVCGSRPNHTSDKSFLLFTKDAGMLWATARSVREERSKQRYALQDFSLIKVSLVRGKSGWRIGSAESEVNTFAAASSRETRGGLAKLLQLLRQFMRGEEAAPSIFDDVREALFCLLEAKDGDVKNLSDAATLRLLYKLGYIAKDDKYSAYLDNGWQTLGELPQSAYEAIEKAKQVSHL